MKLGPRVGVRSVKPRNGFRVLVTFENDVEREIDLEPYLRGPVFEAIRRDAAEFRSMAVTRGVISWRNGADIDPNVLYYGLEPAWMEQRAVEAS